MRLSFLRCAVLPEGFVFGALLFLRPTPLRVSPCRALSVPVTIPVLVAIVFSKIPPYLLSAPLLLPPPLSSSTGPRSLATFPVPPLPPAHSIPPPFLAAPFLCAGGEGAAAEAGGQGPGCSRQRNSPCAGSPGGSWTRQGWTQEVRGGA